MTDEQKREHISFLYRQLDTCGQMIAETEPGPERTRYNRDYRGIINALRPTCGGEFKQTRSGSFRLVCQQCGQKGQLKRKKK